MGVGKVKPIKEKQQTKNYRGMNCTVTYIQNKKSLHQEKLYTYKPVNPAKIIKQS